MHHGRLRVQIPPGAGLFLVHPFSCFSLNRYRATLLTFLKKKKIYAYSRLSSLRQSKAKTQTFSTYLILSLQMGRPTRHIKSSRAVVKVVQAGFEPDVWGGVSINWRASATASPYKLYFCWSFHQSQHKSCLGMSRPRLVLSVKHSSIFA